MSNCLVTKYIGLSLDAIIYFPQAILASVIYQYITGYITHKHEKTLIFDYFVRHKMYFAEICGNRINIKNIAENEAIFT